MITWVMSLNHPYLRTSLNVTKVHKGVRTSTLCSMQKKLITCCDDVFDNPHGCATFVRSHVKSLSCYNIIIVVVVVT